MGPGLSSIREYGLPELRGSVFTVFSGVLPHAMDGALRKGAFHRKEGAAVITASDPSADIAVV